MASFISETQSNPDGSSQEQSRGKKRRKLGHETSSGQNGNDVVNASQGRRSRRWRSETEKQNYSVKLLDALRQRSHRGVSSPRAAVEKGREVRETADRVLATAAKGTTRWSRAILASRVRLRARKVRRAKVTGDGRLRRRKKEEEEEKVPAVEKRVRVLSRLVPGCRSVSSFDSILEETRDYIAALEMQVKAMAALADILVANGSGGGGGDGGGGAAVVESRR